MVYITNTDGPGMIGFIGTTLGGAGVNIANFQLGRDKQGGDAIALL
jgi:D-3-phosphoglycerate dehydrogenase